MIQSSCISCKLCFNLAPAMSIITVLCENWKDDGKALPGEQEDADPKLTYTYEVTQAGKLSTFYSPDFKLSQGEADKDFIVAITVVVTDEFGTRSTYLTSAKVFIYKPIQQNH